MAKNVIIVESPAKAKTLGKYLGKDFEVLSSYGHVRDLVPKKDAVDPENHFSMRYEPIEKNAPKVTSIVKALKSADALYLATDPDREGEAIAWHLLELLKEKKALKDKKVYRVSFNQITKKAVLAAVDSPREVGMDLVEAQQTRRALDFLVGFYLSPLLWKKVGGRLSAGRVQSPALRLIVEREIEIEKFETQEYWRLIADTEKEAAPFSARLTHYEGEKLTQFSMNNEKDAKAAQKALLKAADGKLTVATVEKKERKRNPAPPFTTSTLQQEASRKLGFGASRTMRTAQSLYEGVKIDGSEVGLISYMRTDSTALATEAIESIRALIQERYGKENLPEAPHIYKTKAKNAQEAHEAIRPTDVIRTPDAIKQYLTDDQFKLYRLIWNRAVACQMIHATINTVTVDLNCGSDKNVLRANGSTIANPGFILVYQEGVDDANPDDQDEKMLPALTAGEVLKLNEIHANQHFTEPPPRFSEATLVKALEEFGIGRPSTYASIISTLQNRSYATIDKKRFYPTDVGRVVNRFLTEHFTQYVDYDFTAKMEDALDAVAAGESEREPILKAFWKPFKSRVDTVETDVERKDVVQEAIDEKCPECSAPLSIRLGRNGRFIGCTAYPKCRYTRGMEDTEGSSKPEVIEGRSCPKCEASLVIKVGRYGKFIGCSNYPDCKHMEPLQKPADTGVTCPECKKGTLLKRRSRRGTFFYSCSTYPECQYAVWNPPQAEACPKCSWPILTIKTTKRRGTELVCPQKECDFAEQCDPLPEEET